MSHQRRVKPAAGVAVVGLGIGAGALGLYRGAAADPPRPPVVVAAPTADKLLADGREAIRHNRLPEALAKAHAIARLGDAATAQTLRGEAVADGTKQIDELTAQAKVLSGRGDAARSKASLDLARQIAVEIGLVSAPVSPIVQAGGVSQGVVFRPADEPPPVAVPLPLPDIKSATPPALPKFDLPAPPEKPLLPAPPALSFTPSGPTPTPATPAPGATPVTLPKLASVVAGAALAVAPAPAQDAAPKPGPGTAEVARPIAPAPTPAPVAPPADKAQLDTLRADIGELKDYKRQVQDLLQGKADGPGTGLDAGVLKRLADLERKLDLLEKSVDRMLAAVTKLESSASTAQKPTAPAPAVTKSAVKLVNDYPNDLSIILNGVSHRLKPSETKLVDVTPGSFTYELVADGAKPITGTIRDSETVVLRIK